MTRSSSLVQLTLCVAAFGLVVPTGPAHAVSDTAKCYAKCTKIMTQRIAALDKCIAKEIDKPGGIVECASKAQLKHNKRWYKAGACAPSVGSCAIQLGTMSEEECGAAFATGVGGGIRAVLAISGDFGGNPGTPSLQAFGAAIDGCIDFDPGI